MKPTEGLRFGSCLGYAVSKEEKVCPRRERIRDPGHSTLCRRRYCPRERERERENKKRECEMSHLHERLWEEITGSVPGECGEAAAGGREWKKICTGQVRKRELGSIFHDVADIRMLAGLGHGGV